MRFINDERFEKVQREIEGLIERFLTDEITMDELQIALSHQKVTKMHLWAYVVRDAMRRRAGQSE